MRNSGDPTCKRLGLYLSVELRRRDGSYETLSIPSASQTQNVCRCQPPATGCFPRCVVGDYFNTNMKHAEPGTGFVSLLYAAAQSSIY